MTTTPRRPPAPSDAARRRRAHLSRLGAGLVVVGGAGVAHTLWGLAVDLPLLVVGAAGLLWALATRRPAHLLAAIVLVAVALFALLDDHGVFTGLGDALTLLALAALAVLAHGLPVLWRDAWPLVPAGVLVLLAAFALIRLAAVWAAAPWAPAAPLLVALALVGLAAGLTAQYLLKVPDAAGLVLLVTLLAGGLPVVVGTVWGMLRRKFAADIVATLAIVGAAVTGEYLAGCVIVLMQTGGEALEAYAVRRASAALEALLARAPHVAHRRYGEVVEDVPVEEVAVGDLLLVRPGELIPVDGTVLDGTAAVDASALTGEPVPVLTEAGDEVLSGTGANQFSGTRGASRLSVQNTVAASAPNALAVTIASGRSAYAYKQFRTGYTNYDLTLRLQLGATAWPRPGPAPNTAMDGDMVAAPWRYPGV